MILQKYGRPVLLFSLLIGVLPVNAQFQPSPVINTSAPSLRIPADARAAGMGNLSIASTPDAANSMGALSSKAVFAEKDAGLALHYTPWMRELVDGMYLLQVSGYRKMGSRQALTASVKYFNLGDFKLKDATGELLQATRPREWSADIGYARKLSDEFSLSIAFRYIHSKLASGTFENQEYKAAGALAMDAGVVYRQYNEKGEGFAAGLGLSNMGSRINYTKHDDRKDFLPANIGAGASYRKLLEEDHALLVGVEFNKLLAPPPPTSDAELKDYYNQSGMAAIGRGFGNKLFQYAVGAEYTYKQCFDLRVGFTGESKDQGGQKALTFGAGFHYDLFAVHLAWLSPVDSKNSGSTANPQKNTLRFGVQVSF